jgi:glutathione synthase/RimK-type ligase-like ATP-grasp enzyme
LLAEELRRRGYDVKPVVWTEARPAQVARDVVVIRSVWDYHLRVDEFLGWVDEMARYGVVLNSPEVVRWNSDKTYLEKIRMAGVRVPRTVMLKTGWTTSLRKIVDEFGTKEAVLKPVVSASAFRTHRVSASNAEEFEAEFQTSVRERAMMLQEYVAEITELGEWSLMFFGGEYSHSVRKLPKLGDFRVQAEHGGSHVFEQAPNSVVEVARAVVAQFAAETLYARVDMVERGGDPLLMELELIDPELFVESGSEAVGRFGESCENKV